MCIISKHLIHPHMQTTHKTATSHFQILSGNETSSPGNETERNYDIPNNIVIHASTVQTFV